MKAESVSGTSNSPIVGSSQSEQRRAVRSTLSVLTKARWRASVVLGASLLSFLGARTSFSQTPMPPMAPMAQAPAASAAEQNRQLSEQITALWAEVARLQAAVQRTEPGKRVAPSAPTSMSPAPGMGMGMGMMNGKNGMGMPPGQGAMTPAPAPAPMPSGGGMGMDGMGAMPPPAKPAMPQGGGGMGMMGDKSAMGAMPPPAKPAMPQGGGGMGMMGDKAEMAMPPAGAMGMCCMGEMGGMPGAAGGAPSSAMPGQPGSSHLYHVGSAGFFLNHSQHITLTPEQRLTLNHVKEKAMLDRASEQRQIDQGEQELYILTGADQPDNGRIQAKIVEIEALRADQRMSFIRAVSEANNVLTPDQRRALLGTMAPRR